MQGPPEEHVSDSYFQARERFLIAARARAAKIDGHAIASRSSRGEELSIDTAYLGPDSPECLLAISSGIHGVEGFAGGAIQHQLLRDQLGGLEMRPECGLLLVHGLNPYGFSAVRRVNENNVDLGCGSDAGDRLCDLLRCGRALHECRRNQDRRRGESTASDFQDIAYSRARR
jgi:hypothetical protein